MTGEQAPEGRAFLVGWENCEREVRIIEQCSRQHKVTPALLGWCLSGEAGPDVGRVLWDG